ncbi:hypothetical protein B0H19DRAFT_1122427 [Mycena capillaripes]|nr:hypothetical protein B0H19DRAFT_1122427 [Mycena capillaripes]
MPPAFLHVNFMCWLSSMDSWCTHGSARMSRDDARWDDADTVAAMQQDKAYADPFCAAYGTPLESLRVSHDATPLFMVAGCHRVCIRPSSLRCFSVCPANRGVIERTDGTPLDLRGVESMFAVAILHLELALCDAEGPRAAGCQ